MKATTDTEFRRRLLAAATAGQQLRLASELLKSATAQLESIKVGTAPALEAARKALFNAEVTLARTDELIKRLP